MHQGESIQHRPLWLTWEIQVRNRSLSARMDAHLAEIIEPSGGLRRYIKSIGRTLRFLWRWRGSVVVVQNPSIILSLLAVLLKPVLRYRLIVDAHNSGIYPKDGASSLLMAIANFIIRAATYVIVTNKGLARRVESIGGAPVIVPDPLPVIDAEGSCFHSKYGSYPHSVLFVCTWASDEPYFEVFSAAEQLPDVLFLVTGRSKGREGGYGKALPRNVVLTGFVPEAEYQSLLAEVDIIVDLTTREDCLVCGAYEAVSARKPFVLSNTTALREYFRKGGVHVDNHASSIAEGINKIICEIDLYNNDVRAFREELEMEWVTKFESTKERLMR